MENYTTMNTRLGLPGNTQTYNPANISGRKVTVFSSDPLQSDVAPMNIPVASIAHLNEMIGMPDECDDSHIRYPPRLSELMSEKYLETTQIRQFLHALTLEDRSYIKMAVEAYLMGNSQKVKEYEPLINAAGFPGKVAYFASSHDLEISGEVIIKGEDPVIWNCGRIALKDQAALTVHAPFILSADQLECTAPDSNPNTIAIYPPDFTYKASKGTDGLSGVNGGGKGANGTPGFNGQKGLPQPPFNMTIYGNISGILQIGARGGNGQDGGPGGNGGDGGNGSVQGDGGNGGKGGKSGDGGDRAPVHVIYNSLDGKIEALNLNALPGISGKGGKGGDGSFNGETGDEGETGKPGISSEITIIGAVPS